MKYWVNVHSVNYLQNTAQYWPLDGDMLPLWRKGGIYAINEGGLGPPSQVAGEQVQYVVIGSNHLELVLENGMTNYILCSSCILL